MVGPGAAVYRHCGLVSCLGYAVFEHAHRNTTDDEDERAEGVGICRRRDSGGGEAANNEFATS